MTEHPEELKRSRNPLVNLFRSRPDWQKGFVYGVLFWVFLWATAEFFESFESGFPKWIQDADVPDTLGTIFAVLAFPIVIGGWLLIWGDGPQPPAWVTSWPFNIAFGIALYGLAGTILYRWIANWGRKRS